MGKSILETFTIFPFSIVLALALGEAFKQYVKDNDGNIQWDRTLGLITFLLLILPFYQGMNRYLLQTYGVAAAPSHPWPAVRFVLDGAAFLIESAVFFAMSRNLVNNRWRYFYSIVLVLLLVDSCWGLSALAYASPGASVAIESWIKLNVGFSIFLVLLIWLGKKWDWDDLAVAVIGAIAMLGRTICDYVISWDFYFSP
jgi:hypothetical protein